MVTRGYTPPQKTNTNPEPGLPDEKKFFPSISVFHESTDSSVIFVTVHSKDLLYVRTHAGADFSATMKVQYKIFQPGTKIPQDTGTILVSDADHNGNQIIVARKKIKLVSGSDHGSEFVCTDLNREEKYKIEFFINKSNELNRQNFLLQKENGEPIFGNVTHEKNLWLAYPYLKSGKLWVRYYNRDFKIPSPPFSSNQLEKFSYRPDSIFTINLNDSGFVLMNLKERGFYHFQKDSSKQEGFTLYIFEGGYPEITVIGQMTEPLRYLTSNAEYEKIIGEEDIKKAVDDFWLDKCGSKERARETIKQYYGRVQKANKLYTSYVEGWKTDRGMISVIFGEPYSVSYATDSETWYYNNERAYSYITFSFIKVKNPFSDNDFMLTRDPQFKPQWYRAVENWRQGRAYNANNF